MSLQSDAEANWGKDEGRAAMRQYEELAQDEGIIYAANQLEKTLKHIKSFLPDDQWQHCKDYVKSQGIIIEF